MTSFHPILLLMAFFSVLLTVVFCLEKRMVWPYGAPVADPPFGDQSGYGVRWVTMAKDLGYKFLGWTPDLKGPTYKVSYAMLVSPNRDTFVIIGVGTMMNIPLAATWLHTPSLDGRSYFTTDNIAGVQIDMSRDWTNQFSPQQSFGKLAEKHRQWIAEMNIAPRTFTAGREIEEFRTLREQHFRSMQRAGLIAYTDASATHFRFTLVGAAKTAIWSYFSGMMRRVTSGAFPRTT